MTTKAEIRSAMYRRRRQQKNRESLSRQILDRVVQTTSYRTSRTVLFYASIRSEVSTLEHIAIALAEKKNVFVPMCAGTDLQLFEIKTIDELAAGSFGIPEPRQELRTQNNRFGRIDEIEFAIVPGVAFGRDGSRIGSGRGYYDRLFQARTGTTLRVGVAFECQMYDVLPVDDNDIWMDAIVTEQSVYGPNKSLIEPNKAGEL